MKICMINSFYPPWIGGAESYVSNLARGLARKGHQVTVYCSSRPFGVGESIDQGVKVRRMRTPFMFYGTPVVVFSPQLLAERYDVIHAGFPSPYLAAGSSFVSTLKQTPSVLTWHNDLPAVTSTAGVLVKLHDAFSPSYLSRFSRIIATTAIYVRNSQILRTYASKVRVIHNGVDTARFNPNVSGEDVRRDHCLDGKTVVLFVGALTQWHVYKGLDVLLAAFREVRREMKDVVLLVVGDGELRSKYMSLAEEMGISSSVIFAGSVRNNDLPAYYAACDFAVLPSKDSSEGFGLVLLEAMATGKPVIGSSVGGVVEVISHGLDGVLVKPNDVQDLAAALRIMSQDDSMRTRMGQAGRRFAELHDWSVVVDKVEEVYREVT